MLRIEEGWDLEDWQMQREQQVTTESARDNVADRLAALRQQMNGVELANRLCHDVVSSGYRELDNLLPARGFLRGTLVEWLSPARGSGAATLAFLTSMRACGMPDSRRHQATDSKDSDSKDSDNKDSDNSSKTGRSRSRSLVVMDRARRFYPPAAMAWGVSLEQLLVVRATTAQEELWALDQALRCRSVGAVWACLDQLDSHAFRRFQLAAESNGTLAVLVRPATVQGRPSWSDVQLLVEPQVVPDTFRNEDLRAASSAAGGLPSRSVEDAGMATTPSTIHAAGWQLKVTLLRARRGPGKGDALEGASATVTIDEELQASHETERRSHETHSLSLVSSMGPSASRRRPA